MASFNTNKRAVETFLVSNASDTVVNDGTALIDASTGASNLSDGQVSLFNASPVNPGSGAVAYLESLNHTTTYDTVATAPWIQIYQGTNGSADLYSNPNNSPLWNRPYEASQIIKGENNLLVTKQDPVNPTKSTWVVGTEDGEITALDDTEYTISVAFRGRGQDEMFSPEATNHINASVLTPNFTALSTAEPVDYIIQHMVYELNRNSRALAMNRTRYRGNAPFIAFAVMSQGSPSGGDVISGLSAGTPIDVVSTDTWGQLAYNPDAQDVAAITAAAAQYTSNTTGAHILDVDLSTAGTATGGVADSIIILALDRELAFEDRIPQVKTRLDIGLKRGFDFNTVDYVEQSQASEGQGQGRWLDLWYKATHGQRKYNLDHTQDPVIEFASPIDVDDAYFQYTILHEDIQQVDTGNIVSSPLKEILLVPDANTTLETAIDNILGAWVTSANGTGIVEA